MLFRAALPVILAALLPISLVFAGAAVGHGLRLDVPFVSQVKEGCGSAAISMVLSYWNQHGHNVAESISAVDRIHAGVYSESENGSRAADVERYFQAAGFNTFAFEGKWQDLAEHLSKGRPLVVALRPAGGQRQLHYVVLTGISDRHVLLHDPASKPYAMLARENFEKQWNASKRWTLLALPRHNP